MRHWRIRRRMESHSARYPAWVFRFAEHVYQNLTTAKKIDVIVFEFGSCCRCLDRIKADAYRVRRIYRSLLEREVIQQPDKLPARILVDVQETVARGKENRL